MIPIFLSRPNPFTLEQDFFLENLIYQLKTNEIRNITLEAKDYNPYESLTCLNEMIKRCYGAIIVSFGQSYIKVGISKKGAINDSSFFDSVEQKINNYWITSPFCHIEGTLAFVNNLPIFIMEQDNVKEEGILKRGIHAIHSKNFSLNSMPEITAYFANENFKSSFLLWKEKVNKLYDFANRVTNDK